MKIVMQQFYEISWFFICIVYFVILLPHYIPCRSFNLTVRNKKKKNIRWRGLASLERPARASGNRAWNVYDATRRDASSGRHIRRGVAERQRRPRSTTRSRESREFVTQQERSSRGENCVKGRELTGHRSVTSRNETREPSFTWPCLSVWLLFLLSRDQTSSPNRTSPIYYTYNT